MKTQDVIPLIEDFGETYVRSRIWTEEDFNRFVELVSAEHGELPPDSILWVEVRKLNYFIPSGALRLEHPEGGTVRDALQRLGIIKNPKPGAESHFKANSDRLRGGGDYTNKWRHNP